MSRFYCSYCYEKGEFHHQNRLSNQASGKKQRKTASRGKNSQAALLTVYNNNYLYIKRTKKDNNKRRFKTMTKTERLNTNGAEAKQTIRNHITINLADGYKDYESLQEQLNAIKDRQTVTDYQAAIKMVEGGYFLIYYVDINRWLLNNNLTTQKHLDKFGDDGAWEFYKHLIARELQHAGRWYNSELEKLNAKQI